MFKVVPEQCIGCGVCQKECIRQAIQYRHGDFAINKEHCSGCGECAEICPQGCIISETEA